MPSFVRAALLALALLLARAPLVASAQADHDALVSRVLELTNIERQKVGAPPLVASTELTSAAQAYSVVLASGECFDHACGAVPDMKDRLEQAGYQGWSAIGENIAAGYRTPEAVVAGWMASTGHRENLLSARYTEIGIGLATSSSQFGTYWTQDFGTRRLIPVPEVQPTEVVLVPEPDTAPTDDARPTDAE